MKTLKHFSSHELHTLDGYTTYNTLVDNPSDPNNPFFYTHGTHKPHNWNEFFDVEIYAEVEDETQADYWSLAHNTFIKIL